jgi:hypothetical protein
MSVTSGLRSGIRSGLRLGLNPGSDPRTNTPEDATAEKYVPVTAADWAGILEYAGLSSSPAYGWGFQEASGSIDDQIGVAALTASGGTYQQTVTGWSRKACTWAFDGSGTTFYNVTDIPNPNANSMAVLLYVYTSSVPAADRQVVQIGSATAVEARVTTAGKYQCHNQAIAASGNFAGAYDDNVHPLLLVYNRTANTMTLYSDTEFATTTYADISGGGIIFGAGDRNTPTGGVLLAAGWTGADAEFSDADARALLEALGWTVPW